MIWPENALILAPVAGYTDLPGRLSMRRHGCRYAFTEMVDAGSLTYANPKSRRILERGKTEDFLGVQLVGADPAELQRAAEIVNDLDFDVLDFNLGCPAPKVARKCEGITLALEKPDEAVRLTEMLVKLSRVPVTVKTRIHSFDDPAPTVAFLKRLEQTGIAAVTLHGRIKSAFYSGEPSFEVIRAAREALSIPLVANGGVMNLAAYRRMREKTGCTRVMVARGALGNPWIFEELSNPEYLPPTVAEFAKEFHAHALGILDCYGPENGFPIMRKTLLEYLKGRGYPGSLRASVSFVSSAADLDRLEEQLLAGPSEGYWSWLENVPDAPGRLRRT